MNQFKELSSEVSCNISDYSSIDKNDINYLISKASNLESKKYRLCMHESIENSIHEMFIVHPYNMYIRPHKHNNKSESMVVISGEAEYIIYNENGDIEDTIPLGVFNGKKKFYVKTNEKLYHSLKIYSEWFVFLEITKGPFKRKETIFPNWAPNPENTPEVKKFMLHLNERLRNKKL